MKIESQEVARASKGSRFSRSLLASTCLTAVSAVGASATTFNESSAPGGVFPSTGPGFLLPVGTDVVNGFINAELQYSFFEFTGLQPNAFVNVFGFAETENLSGDQYGIFNSEGHFLAQGTLPFPGATMGENFLAGGPVPLNGNLVIGICDCGAETPANYSIQISVESVSTPEPSALIGTGLATGAGLLAWRRRKKNS